MLKKQSNPNLSGEHDGATGLLNLLLGGLRDELGLDHDGLVLRQHALAEDLEEAVLSHIDERGVVLGGLVLGLLREERPELVDVDDGAVELVAELVKVPHTDFTEIPRMVLVEEDPVVVHASGVTATSGMLAVLADTTVTGADVASLLAVLLESGRHFSLFPESAPPSPTHLARVSQMKRLDFGSMNDSSSLEDIVVDPVVRGLITDWDAMEDLLHHVLYTGLGWEMGNEGQILFTDPLCTPKSVREQLVQLMFETFNTSGFYASEQAVLSLYAVGRISGCTVDIGHGKIDIAPVVEGAVQHIASRRFEIGGTDLTKLLAEELGKSNPLVNIKMSDIEKIKEQYSCCAEDELVYEKTKKSCQIEQHTLPDGQVIRIGRERYTVGEALFQPSILGLEAHGIVEQLVRCISTVSSDNHRQLLENTVLCGGTASMIGFEERFQKEAGLCSSAVHPALIKPPEYMPENLSMYSAWVGGAILAKVVFPQNQHITKADYDETGPSVVHRKCF